MKPTIPADQRRKANGKSTVLTPLIGVVQNSIEANGKVSGDSLTLLRSICDGIAALWGDGCEVVLHDFHDLEHSVVHVAGNLTGREVGAPLTDLGLRTLTSGRPDQSVLIYHSKTPRGTLMKSVSILLRARPEEPAIGALCINVEVEDLRRVREIINQMIAVPSDVSPFEESFQNSPREMILSFVTEILAENHWLLPTLTREQRHEIVRELDMRGAFAFRSAPTIVAEILDVSRYTVYNDLKQVRGGTAGN